MSSHSIRPVRPNAIATFITTDDFLPGAQSLLHSLKEKLPTEPFATDYYPPELLVIITKNLSSKVRQALHPAFCTRLIEVDPIPIPASLVDDNGSDCSSHVESRSEKCGYTKLHMFNYEIYNKILYIGSDCLVQKDISHLFRVENELSRGLIAAAPDISPPDKFNADVMLIKPSKELFSDLLSKTKTLITYDGSDTGFLNAYFDDWHSYPAEGRLGFQYNAQRFMHQCTYSQQTKYWDIAVGDMVIINYSLSKPWESTHKKVKLSQSGFLNKEDADRIEVYESKSKSLEKLWKKWYKKSLLYKEEFDDEQRLKKKQQPVRKNPTPAPAPSRGSQGATKKKASLDFNKRFKQFRKEGMDAKQAMKKARQEFGYDKQDEISAGKKVAQMFGMPI